MNVLAIGAHWDDIELGCGVTLKKLNDRGHSIFTAVVCGSQYGQKENEGMEEEEALKCGLNAFGLIGARYLETPKEPNSQLVYSKRTMQTFEELVITNKIDTIFTHWFGDVNTDHRVTWEISRTAFRGVKNFFTYQSNSYNSPVDLFKPNCFFSFNKEEYCFKEKLLSQYVAEWKRREFRWRKEIFEKEQQWGYLAGNDYAEGFQIGRLVNFFA